MVGCWIWIEMNHWWCDPCVPLNWWWVLNVSSCKWTWWVFTPEAHHKSQNQPTSSKSGSTFLKVHCFKTWIDFCSGLPGTQSTQGSTRIRLCASGPNDEVWKFRSSWTAWNSCIHRWGRQYSTVFWGKFWLETAQSTQQDGQLHSSYNVHNGSDVTEKLGGRLRV